MCVVLNVVHVFTPSKRDIPTLMMNDDVLALWHFAGMHFSQAVAIIQSQVGIIKGVQVLYSDTVSLSASQRDPENITHQPEMPMIGVFVFFFVQNPLGVDIVINLPQDGIRLIFDPIVQRLKAIEVFNMKLVKLKYGYAYVNQTKCTNMLYITDCFCFRFFFVQRPSVQFTRSRAIHRTDRTLVRSHTSGRL